MRVYRIVQGSHRAKDLSGIGSFMEGGRWNSPGTYALYTSENRALAALEMLVHFEATEAPPNMFIMTIDVNDKAAVFTVAPDQMPADWRIPGNSAIKAFGDTLLSSNRYIALKVVSAIMPMEYNYVLNPRYPGFNDLVKVIHTEAYSFDERLL